MGCVMATLPFTYPHFFDCVLMRMNQTNAAVFRLTTMVLTFVLLTACQPPQPATPRSTAPAILEIIPAPTFDIDATATNYARLLIPSPTPAGLYVVQSGDTLGALAQEFGTTIDELLAANGLIDPNAIQVGQTLIIPSLVNRPLATPASISPTIPSATPSPTERPTATATRLPTLTPVPPTSTNTEIPAPPTETLAPVPLDIPTLTPVP